MQNAEQCRTMQNDNDNNATDGKVIASCPMFPQLPQEATEEETSQDHRSN